MYIQLHSNPCTQLQQAQIALTEWSSRFSTVPHYINVPRSAFFVCGEMLQVIFCNRVREGHDTEKGNLLVRVTERRRDLQSVAVMHYVGSMLKNKGKYLGLHWTHTWPKSKFCVTPSMPPQAKEMIRKQACKSREKQDKDMTFYTGEDLVIWWSYAKYRNAALISVF